MKGMSRLGAVIAAIVALTPGAASADKAAADAAFAEAKRLVAANQLAEACPKFELSYAEDPQLGSLLNVADCHERLGRLATARAEFRSAVELAHRRKDRRERYASDRAAALDRRVASVVIHRRSGVGDLVVLLDDKDVTATIDAELPIDLGHHELAVTVAAVGTWSMPVDVDREGSRREITVPNDRPPDVPVAVTPPPTPPAPPPTPAPVVVPRITTTTTDDSARSTRHILGGAIVGAGLVVVGVGLYFGHRAFSDWDQSHSSGDCDKNNVCNLDGRQLVDAAGKAAVASDIVVGVGGAVIAAAAIVWLTAPAERRVVVAPIASPTSVGAALSVRF
jgi:hypothetical protein